MNRMGKRKGAAAPCPALQPRFRRIRMKASGRYPNPHGKIPLGEPPGGALRPPWSLCPARRKSRLNSAGQRTDDRSSGLRRRRLTSSRHASSPFPGHSPMPQWLAEQANLTLTAAGTARDSHPIPLGGGFAPPSPSCKCLLESFVHAFNAIRGHDNPPAFAGAPLERDFLGLNAEFTFPETITFVSSARIYAHLQGKAASIG